MDFLLSVQFIVGVVVGLLLCHLYQRKMGNNGG